MFTVLNRRGCVKARPGGPGAHLPDPLTSDHGGLGLTQIPQGTILISRAAHVWTPLAKDATAAKLLCNAQTPGYPDDRSPGWAVQSIAVPAGLTKPAVYALGGSKIYFSVVDVLGNFNGAGNSIGWSPSGGSSTTNDAVSSWRVLTTGTVAGNGASWTTNAWTYLDHEPYLAMRIRTPSPFTLQRIYLGITNLGSAFTGVSDDISANKFVGVRYATGAADPGWMAVTADGVSMAVSPTPIASFAPATVYLVTIKVRRATAGTYVVELGIDGVIVSVPVPPACLATNMNINLSITTMTTVAKTLDIASVLGIVART